MESFRVRPGYQSKLLLVEFWGDHRGQHFPNLAKILARGLNAKSIRHPTLDTEAIAVGTDEVISMWRYEHGDYELDDDIWAFFIHAPTNNAQIIADIERVLLASGEFEKVEADFGEYV